MQTASNPPLIPQTFISSVQTQILSPIITLLALAAFILFAYGVFELIRKGGDKEARSTGRQHVIWGLVGLVILFGANVIVKLISNTANSIGTL